MTNSIVPLVSIVICVYNGEKYLRRCLQSVIKQSYEHIEIIVVNDGSVDNSKAIIEEYAKLDSRVVMIDKLNNGIAEARKTGINHAKGKYIQYLDCDDALIDNAIEYLVNRAEDTQADIIASPFFLCDGEDKKLSDIVEFEQMSGIEYLRCILQSKAYWAMWTKFHLRSLYSDNIERLNMSFGEDVVLSTQILLRAEKVFSIDTPVIDYYIYPSSISHDLGERAYRDFCIYTCWIDDYIVRVGLKETYVKDLALFHVRNTQARLHWKKIKDVHNEMSRLLVELRDYPDLKQLLSHRERKIVETYRVSALLGYWRLCYYNWKNKL